MVDVRYPEEIGRHMKQHDYLSFVDESKEIEKNGHTRP
jgi:hypothetical protein